MSILHCFYHIAEVLSAVLFCTAAQSCNTIMESRDECPCVLTVDFSKINGNVKNAHVWVFDAGGKLLFKDTADKKSFATPYVVDIKKGEIFCYAWCNMGNATVCSERFSMSTTIEKAGALSADSLFFFKYSGVADGEEHKLYIYPNKEFATVNIKFAGLENGVGAEAEMVCNSGGFFVDGACMDKVSFTNVSTINQGAANKASDIYVSPVPYLRQDASYSNASLRMLRQKSSDGIYINIYVLQNVKDAVRIQAGTFELGKYLRALNYDMHAASLKDIDLLIDMGAMTASITVEGWNVTVPITIEF